VSRPYVIYRQDARRTYASIYSEGDFEVCRPRGATRCTDWVKFEIEGHSISAGWDMASKNCKLYEISEYKHPWHDFHKICRVCG